MQLVAKLYICKCYTNYKLGASSHLLGAVVIRAISSSAKEAESNYCFREIIIYESCILGGLYTYFRLYTFILMPLGGNASDFGSMSLIVGPIFGFTCRFFMYI